MDPEVRAYLTLVVACLVGGLAAWAVIEGMAALWAARRKKRK